MSGWLDRFGIIQDEWLRLAGFTGSVLHRMSGSEWLARQVRYYTGWVAVSGWLDRFGIIQDEWLRVAG